MLDFKIQDDDAAIDSVMQILLGNSDFVPLPYQVDLQFWKSTGKVDVDLCDVIKKSVLWHVQRSPETQKLVSQRDALMKDLGFLDLVFDFNIFAQFKYKMKMTPLGEVFFPKNTDKDGAQMGLKVAATLLNGFETLTEQMALRHDVLAKSAEIEAHLRDKLMKTCQEALNIFFTARILKLKIEQIHTLMIQTDLEKDRIGAEGGSDKELVKIRATAGKVMADLLSELSKKRGSVKQLMDETDCGPEETEMILRLLEAGIDIGLDIFRLVSPKARVFVERTMSCKTSQELDEIVQSAFEDVKARSSVLRKLSHQIDGLNARLRNFYNPLRMLSADVKLEHSESGPHEYDLSLVVNGDFKRLFYFVFRSSKEKEIRFSLKITESEKQAKENELRSELRIRTENLMQLGFALFLRRYYAHSMEGVLERTCSNFVDGVQKFPEVVQSIQEKFKAEEELEQARKELVKEMINLEKIMEGETDISSPIGEYIQTLEAV